MLNVFLILTIIITAITLVKPLKCNLNISSNNKQYIEEIIKDIPEHAPMKATIKEIQSIRTMRKSTVQECINNDRAFCMSMHIYNEEDGKEKLSIRGCDESYQCPGSNCNEFSRPNSKYTINYCCCKSDFCNSTLQLDSISIEVIFVALLALC